MSLDLESERFAPSGGIDGRAARRAMGTPEIEFWDLFLRETLQNSWDARTRPRNRIGFSVDAIRLTVDQQKLMREYVFRDLPASLAADATFSARGDIELLVIADTHTKGLGGVTRADVAPEPNESRDYVDFVRNIGRDSTKKLGGGTYGFGKSVLYDASTISTCLVYSQTHIGDALVNRFIALTVGNQFDHNGHRFTGRHWWGKASEGFVEPLSGAEARDLAVALGLTPLRPDETGTSIAVVQPWSEPGNSLIDAVDHIARAATEWAWPHMLDVEGGPSIEFKFSAFGEEVVHTDPSTHPSLQHFVRAFEQATLAAKSPKIADVWPWTNHEVVVERPVRRRAGILTYRKYMVPEDAVESNKGHHIALMRSPLFVVKYLPIPEDVSGAGIAGVFIVDEGADVDFALAEPVSHDDWVPNKQDGSRTNIVRVALTRIREVFRPRAVEIEAGVGNESASGVALVSRLLGSVLSGTQGPGAELQRRTVVSRGSTGVRQNARIQMAAVADLMSDDDAVIADFNFTFETGVGISQADYFLDAEARVVLDGNSVEADDARPVGAATPEVLGFLAGGEWLTASSTVDGQTLPSSALSVRIRQPSGVAVTAVVTPRRKS